MLGIHMDVSQWYAYMKKSQCHHPSTLANISRGLAVLAPPFFHPRTRCRPHSGSLASHCVDWAPFSHCSFKVCFWLRMRRTSGRVFGVTVVKEGPWVNLSAHLTHEFIVHAMWTPGISRRRKRSSDKMPRSKDNDSGWTDSEKKRFVGFTAKSGKRSCSHRKELFSATKSPVLVSCQHVSFITKGRWKKRASFEFTRLQWVSKEIESTGKC